MPATLAAALVFAVLIVPGYQLVRGYAMARGDAPPEPQLHVLAQAVVASLGWLVLTWPAISQLMGWVRDDEISKHILPTYAIVPLLVGVPYVLGRQLGRLAVAITRRHDRLGPDWVQGLAYSMGVTERLSAWDQLWLRAVAHPSPLVTVALDDGTAIHGQFGEHSRVMASPAEPAVYFERAYETNASTGAITAVYPGGAHIDGARIVALKLHP